MSLSNDPMDVATSEMPQVSSKTSATASPVVNATQSQIAQKQWEMANFIQGKFHDRKCTLLWPNAQISISIPFKK